MQYQCFGLKLNVIKFLKNSSWTKRYVHCIKYLLFKIYSKSPLIQLTWSQTGAKLSNILYYWVVPVLNKVLTGNYLLLLLYFGCIINKIWISPSSAGSGPSLCFIDEAYSFLVKIKTSILGINLFKCNIIRISGLLYIGLKEFCCICICSILLI
jgi:hypothetical protein